MTRDEQLKALLRPEGSELRIQMASSANLDWTYRVTFFDGLIGSERSVTGADLCEVLDELHRMCT